jgi:Ca2+-binding EF-hand superfamily protein
VTLRWVFTEGFFKRIAELKKIFAQADADGNGTLSREEMSAALDDHNGNVSPELKSFLERAMTSNRVNPALGYGALFDIIEGDDDNKLSWSEFEQFFMTAGWTSVPGTTSRPLTASSGAMSTAESAANLKDIVYVVERCVSEFDAEYQEVVRTAAGEITVSRLDPGLSYRFRVYAINSSGKPGPKSDSVIVHTMIEIPPAPTCQGRNIGTRKVVLEWKGRTKAKSSRDKTVVEKMIGNWAGTQGQGETGVSVEAAFARYDKDKNGSIDLEEFALMLEDLGVDVTEERLGEAFAEFDADKNRRLSFDEFSRWWRRDEVTYIIKRSDAVGPLCKPAIYTGSQANSMRLSYGAPPSPSPSHFRNSLGGSGGRARSPGVARVSSTFSIADDRNTPGSRQRSSSVGRRSSSGANLLASSGLKDDPARRSKRARAVPMPIVSYRGNKTRCEIAGLEPNRLYHYRLRYSGSRSNSELSAPLVLMTAPLSITDRPLLVTLSATTVRVKWYPPEFGAFKFLVQLRVESRNSGLANVGIGTEVTADGWATVYNGSDTLWTGTTMTPDSEYSCRVLCVNSQGTASEPSPVLTFQTQKRAAAQALTPKTADLNFTIESTGDICVGDTILLTERLFAKHGAPATPRRGAAVSSGSVAGSRAGSRVGSPRKAAWGGLRPTLTESPARGVAGRAAGIRTSASKSGIKMDASIVSLVSGDGSVDGELLGERIIAAHVVKDNYRSLRDAVPYHNTDGRPPGMRPVKYTRRDCKKASKDRTLWLEVVWQKATTEACKPYELKPGVIGQRVQNALERFEVFRCAWSDESLRRPQWEDWSSMSECFIQVDTD